MHLLEESHCKQCDSITRNEISANEGYVSGNCAVCGTLKIHFRLVNCLPNTAEVGDIFQINEKYPRPGWTGAFVLVTEVKGWGIQGFIHNIDSDDKHSEIYIRLKWEYIEKIGSAVLVPAPYEEEQQQ